MREIQARCKAARWILPLALCALLLGSGMELRAQSEAVVVTSATNSEIVVATLMTAEGGGFTLNGKPFTGGADNPVAAAGGRMYVLTLAADGSWSAVFQPMELTVALGDSGDSVILMSTEAGGYTLDGAAVEEASMAVNSAGESYALTMGADGVWMATHQPMEAAVTLGSRGGNVTLMTDEAGRWTLDGDSFSSGQTLERGTNAATGAMNTYELTLADGVWTAEYRAMSMTIAGTGIEAMAREDGSGYDVGDGSLPASGAGDVTGPGDAMYRVAKDADGMLAGTRFDMPMVGDPMTVDAFGADNPAPKLSADNRDTDVNEKGTMLEAVKAKFSMADLLGSGAATATGPNIVAKARGEMVKIRDRVAALVALRRDDGISSELFADQVDNQWDRADLQMEAIFGGDRMLERTASESRVVDAFDRVVNALSSADAFAAATLDGGPDQMQGFLTRTAAQATTAFNRNKWTATARFGTLGSTRFGAAMYNETDKAQSGYGDADQAQAFAWATMDATRRSTDVLVSGSAVYTGSTHAADQAGNLYSGDIDVVVRFTHMAVDGLITGLARADTQEPWTYGLGGEVTGIYLPTGTLNRRGAWTASRRGGSTGRLKFTSRAGASPDEDLDAGSTFSGQLLGRGEQAGAEAIGTWKVMAGSTILAGGFGASRGLDRAPPGSEITGDFTKIGKTGNTWARLEMGPTPALAAVADNAGTTDVNEKRPAVPVSTVINTANTKFKYDPPVADDPGGAEFVTGNYEPQRAAVLEDPEFEQTRGNWVADARAEIVKKLAQLRRSIDLDNADADSADRKFANDQRQRLFSEIQTEIMKVFGPGRAAVEAVVDDPNTQNVDETVDAVTAIYTGVLTREAGEGLGATDAWSNHTDYPVNGAGVAEDAGVLAEIEDVLEALGDADAFAAAFDSGGLFADVKSDSEPLIDPYPSASAMFDRPRGKLLIVSAHTDYTRFGAWSHQVSAYAAASLAPQTYDRQDRGPELGVFAYSPLDPTAAYSSATHRLYPANGATSNVSATYAGETVATQANLFYRGVVEATAFWNPSDVESSAIVVTVSDLVEQDSGDPLAFGRYLTDEDGNARPGIEEVLSLKWVASITNSGEVRFASSDPVEVTVNSPDGLKPGYNTELQYAITFGTQTTPDQHRFGTAENHLILSRPDITPNSGDQNADEDYGELSLTMVVEGGGSARAPTAAELAQFARDQQMLRYPTHVARGPDVAESTSGTNSAASKAFVFADGSMLQFGEAWISSPPQTGIREPWRRAIGIDSARSPDSIYAYSASGDPTLAANDGEHLFTVRGGFDSKGYPTTGINIGPAAGTGAPATSPSALFEAYIMANGYTNVDANDAEALASEINGMFVGQDQAGPLGIIGNWSLTGGVFGVEGERGAIRGTFGADVQP